MLVLEIIPDAAMPYPGYVLCRQTPRVSCDLLVTATSIQVHPS